MQISDEMVRAALKKAPEFWRDYHSAEGHMRAALEAAFSAMWRPIEDAPKDGAPILVWYQQEVRFAEWYQSRRRDSPTGWRIYHRGYYSSVVADPSPTNFMPLPSPPKMEG